MKYFSFLTYHEIRARGLYLFREKQFTLGNFKGNEAIEPYDKSLSTPMIDKINTHRALE
jgi:hypothetical protein